MEKFSTSLARSDGTPPTGLGDCAGADKHRDTSLQCAVDISRNLLSKELRKDTPYLTRKGMGYLMWVHTLIIALAYFLSYCDQCVIFNCDIPRAYSIQIILCYSQENSLQTSMTIWQFSCGDREIFTENPWWYKKSLRNSTTSMQVLWRYYLRDYCIMNACQLSHLLLAW